MFLSELTFAGENTVSRAPKPPPPLSLATPFCSVFCKTVSSKAFLLKTVKQTNRRPY